MPANGPGTPANSGAGAGAKGKAGSPRSRLNSALLDWPGAQPLSGQDCLKHAKAGWPGAADAEPASPGVIQSEAARLTGNWGTDGAAPASPWNSEHGAALAAGHGADGSALGRRSRSTFLDEAAGK